MYSPNHSLHSATNRLLRSENFSQWRKFNAFATDNAGFSEVDADEKFNYSLPSARVPESDHIKNSASALNAKINFSKNSFGGASRKGSAFISPAANEAFRTNMSPRLNASRVKDNSSAARHGSSHLRNISEEIIIVLLKMRLLSPPMQILVEANCQGRRWSL